MLPILSWKIFFFCPGKISELRFSQCATIPKKRKPQEGWTLTRGGGYSVNRFYFNNSLAQGKTVLNKEIFGIDFDYLCLEEHPGLVALWEDDESNAVTDDKRIKLFWWALRSSIDSPSEIIIPWSTFETFSRDLSGHLMIVGYTLLYLKEVGLKVIAVTFNKNEARRHPTSHCTAFCHLLRIF